MNGQCEATGESGGNLEEQEAQLKSKLERIRHKYMVLSGKGGVGKSSVAVNLAVSLAHEGHRVGLLDIDFHGPSVPTMLGLQEATAHNSDGEIEPIEIGLLKVMSIGFLIPDRTKAVIWRGPMKAGVLRQLVGQVRWGDLDYLIMDFPPGTGDEALSACQLAPDADGGIVVTTPQEVSLADCRRCISFCRTLGLPVAGVVENMSGLICADCGKVIEVFGAGGGERMAEEEGVPFLGRIPLDTNLMSACDEGVPFVRKHRWSETAKAFAGIVEKLCGDAVSKE